MKSYLQGSKLEASLSNFNGKSLALKKRAAPTDQDFLLN